MLISHQVLCVGKGGGSGSSVVSFWEADNVTINSWQPSTQTFYVTFVMPLPDHMVTSNQKRQAGDGMGRAPLHSEARWQPVKKHTSVKESSISPVPRAVGLLRQDKDIRAFPGNM